MWYTGYNNQYITQKRICSVQDKLSGRVRFSPIFICPFPDIVMATFPWSRMLSIGVVVEIMKLCRNTFKQPFLFIFIYYLICVCISTMHIYKTDNTILSNTILFLATQPNCNCKKCSSAYAVYAHIEHQREGLNHV